MGAATPADGPAAPGVGGVAAFAPDFLSRIARAVQRPASNRFEWTRRPGVGPGLHVLGDLRGKTVVEVGCGVGFNLSHLVGNHDARGVGVDHSPEIVATARAMFGHLGIEFVYSDAAAYLLSVPPGSVDVCLSVFGAFTFGEPAVLLRAAAVALRPGGLLAVALREDDEHDCVFVLQRSGKALIHGVD
jgi:SAM-dependent methyltransferase